MAEGLNRVTLLGNLGADPDLRFGQGPETAVLKLRLATTESYFDKRSNERKERTDWHNVVVFGKRGEALQKILAKGSTILVEGRLATSSYEKEGQKHYRTEVIATNIILAGRSAGAGAGAGPNREEGGAARPQMNRPAFERAAPRAAPAAAPAEEDFGGHVDPGADDDIPF